MAELPWDRTTYTSSSADVPLRVSLVAAVPAVLVLNVMTVGPFDRDSGRLHGGVDR